MRRFLLPLAALVVARPAAADVDLVARLGSIWVTDRAFDLFSTTDAIPSVQIGAGWEGDGPLSFELVYGFSGSAATTFDVLETRFFLHQFQAAALYRVPFSPNWRAFGRGAAGFELAGVRIEDPRATVLGDTAPGLGLEGTAGIELRLPISASGNPWAASLGFTVEAGYGWRPIAASFDDARVDRDGDAEPPPVRAGPVDVGDLDLSGPILRFGGLLRF